MLEAIITGLIIGTIVPIVLWPFFPKWMKEKPKPKRRRLRPSSKPPKTLPWFDKDYMKNKRKRKNDIYF